MLRKKSSPLKEGAKISCCLFDACQIICLAGFVQVSALAVNDDNYGEILNLQAANSLSTQIFATAQYLADYPQQAARPANSVLENYMFKMTNGYMFSSWEDAIKEYMKTLV